MYIFIYTGKKLVISRLHANKGNIPALLFEKEQRRTRYAARYKTKNRHIAPAHYDVLMMSNYNEIKENEICNQHKPAFLRKSCESDKYKKIDDIVKLQLNKYVINSIHPLFQESIVVAAIDGMSFHDTIITIFQGMHTVKTSLFSKLNKKLEKIPQKDADVYINHTFDQTLSLISFEFHSQYRFILSAMHSLITFSKGIWCLGLFHCDSHLSNVFLQHTYTNSSALINKSFKYGSAFLLHSNRLTVKDILPQDMKSITSHQKASLNIKHSRLASVDGVRQATWTPDSVYLIDHMFLLQITELLNSEGTSNIYNPCGNYRHEAYDDFALLPNFDHVVATNLNVLFKKTIEEIETYRTTYNNPASIDIHLTHINNLIEVTKKTSECYTKNENMQLCKDKKTKKQCSVKHMLDGADMLLSCIEARGDDLINLFPVKNLGYMLKFS